MKNRYLFNVDFYKFLEARALPSNPNFYFIDCIGGLQNFFQARLGYVKYRCR